MNDLQSSKSIVIVLHEIYGVNDHMESICNSLRSEGFDVVCPNLIGRDPFSYEEESAAYSYFVNEVGFSKAVSEVRQLMNQLKEQYAHIFILGFSVGATTAWLCSDTVCDGVIGFYGSRIRDHLEVKPLSPVLLFFPAYENSFDVNQLIENLLEKTSVRTHQFDGGHGFSNPFSNCYNHQSAKDANQMMIGFINSIID